MDELTYTHWFILFIGSLIMGMSKGGLPGAGNLTVAIYALVLEDALGPVGVPLSVGLLLPVLISADLTATLVYRKHTDWKFVIRLLPCFLIGTILGWLVFDYFQEGSERVRQLKYVIGGILLTMTALHFFVKAKKGIQKDQVESSNNSPKRSIILGWFFGLVGEGQIDQDVEDSLLEIVRAKRDHPNIYKSRLSGLLFKESKSEKFLSSDLVSFLLTSLKISQEVKGLNLEGSAGNQLHEVNSTDSYNLLSLSDQNVSGLGTVLQDESIPENEPTFDCDVIREYRLLNADDPQIASLSNRELVLTLGLSFESLGDEVLEQISEKDPLFYRFYLSLKEIHSTDK